VSVHVIQGQPRKPGERRIRWGVLSTARIACTKVIPAMLRGRSTEVVAIASRDSARAARAAAELGLARSYGSYDALLETRDIDAVYIPLPNHEHVPWAIRAAEAGKHVLVEKPVALDAAEAERLLEVRDRTGVKIQEAFMIRAHPQWERAIELVRSGRIGDVRGVQVHFSYRNLDPSNIRNIAAAGGGALMDIGCYIIHASRWVFDAEPVSVRAKQDRDPVFGVDRLTTMDLDFGENRHGIGTCATQGEPGQWVHIFSESGRIQIQIPFNAPADRPCRIIVDDGSESAGIGIEEIDFPVVDQYTIQGDRFSRAILDGTPQPLPLEDAIANMRVIDEVRMCARR
jgi:predicted dehydrogenase